MLIAPHHSFCVATTPFSASHPLPSSTDPVFLFVKPDPSLPCRSRECAMAASSAWNRELRSLMPYLPVNTLLTPLPHHHDFYLACSADIAASP